MLMATELAGVLQIVLRSGGKKDSKEVGSHHLIIHWGGGG